MDWLIGSGVAAFTMYAAHNWRQSDQRKIEHVFTNIGYTVKGKRPTRLRTIKRDKYTEYVYNVPYGLVDDDKLQVIEKTLHKPTHIYFDSKLHIRVYNQKLPTKFKYDWQSTDGWTVPIGMTQEKLILHDFDEIPHMTVAGMTRNGKSVLLKLILAHLTNNHPTDAEFTIIDLKGGLEFNPYKRLKTIRMIASSVFEANKALSDVLKEIKTDMSLFKEEGYNNVLNTNITRRKFIIVDEAAEMTPPEYLDKDEKKPYQYCQSALSEIARIGGSLGYRLIFATQYPTADTLPRQVKQNADAKISFRLPTEVASRVAIDENGAEKLGNPGRAIYRTHEKHVLQVPFVSDAEIENKLEGYYVSDGKKTAAGSTDHVTFG